ncbi:membrane protein of unknown function [Pararobbsia alpina]|uniref:glycosyltransferase family 39 protein n=1 Tax=Pararobbsia alpina TaxID=621374 RepID=UPI0039A5A04A
MTRADIQRFVGYAGVGASGTAIQYVVVAVLVEAGLFGIVPAACLGTTAGAIVNYGLNCRYVFRTRIVHWLTAPRFFSVALLGVVLNGALMALLVERMNMPWFAAQCAATACVMPLTYIASAVWAFGSEREDRFEWIGLIAVHAIVWTIAAWLSRGNLDLQGDMIENYAWGIEWQAGYAKHPPLFAWIVAAWFSVFPRTDIAYFALSATNIAIGLSGIVAIGSCFLSRRFAVMAALAMAVSPLYSNLAIKFNANAVLLSVWPWTAYCFVRFAQTGSWRAALALGVTAGAAMLGKYFSIVLLLGLCLAMLARPAWRERFFTWRSAAALAACAAVLMPHVAWLVHHDFMTFGYAGERTGGTVREAVARLGVYTAAQIEYLVLSLGFIALSVCASKGEALKSMLAACGKPSRNPGLWWLSFAPMCVVAFIAIAARTQMASVWGMAQWFAITSLWVYALRGEGFDVAPRRSAILIAGYWAIVLAVCASIGLIGAIRHTDDAAEPRQELAQAAHDLWRQRVGGDIPIVSGSVHEAQSIVFYGNGRSRFWHLDKPSTTPWLTPTDLVKHGAVFVCRAGDEPCLSASASITGKEPIPLAIRKRAWTIEQPAHDYVLFLMAPRS